MQQQKIELYQIRDFSALFNVVFSFLRQHVKPLFAALFNIVGPVILVGILVIGFVQGNIAGSFLGLVQGGDEVLQSAEGEYAAQQFAYKWVASGVGNMLFSLILYVLISLTVLVYLKLQQEQNEESVAHISPKAVWNGVKPYLPAAFAAVCLFYLISLLGTLLCILPGIFISISLSLVLPLIVMEELGAVEALKRSYTLIKENWWFTFGYIAVMLLLSSMLVSLLYLPPYFALMISVFFGVQDPQQILLSLQENIYWILIVFYGVTYAGKLISQTLLHTALAFQYGNLVEQKEARGLQGQIDRSENAPFTP